LTANKIEERFYQETFQYLCDIEQVILVAATAPIKQVYADTQQLGLQSARFVQRGKHNRTLNLSDFRL